MLLDLLSHHPEYLLGGVVAWIIVCAWVMFLMHRMIMAEVEPFIGIVALSLILGLGYMTMKPTVPILQPVSFVALFLSGFVIPVLRFYYHRKELKSVDIEGIEKAYDGFIFRPNNPAAQIRLARHLFNLGIRGHAIVHAEWAIQQLPRQYFPDEHRMLEGWRKHPPPQSEFEPIACIECQTPNVAGSIHCVRCGAPYLLDRVRGKPVSTAMGRRILASWILMILVLVGLPVAASLGKVFGLIAILAMTVAAVGTAIIAFRAPKDQTA